MQILYTEITNNDAMYDSQRVEGGKLTHERRLRQLSFTHAWSIDTTSNWSIIHAWEIELNYPRVAEPSTSGEATSGWFSYEWVIQDNFPQVDNKQLRVVSIDHKWVNEKLPKLSWVG